MKTEPRHAFWTLTSCALVVCALGACQFLVESRAVVWEWGGGDLMEALEAGELEEVREMLEAGVRPGLGNASGESVVMVALRMGEPGLALQLIESGADLEARDETGASALYHAVRTGDAAVVKALLDCGMSPNEDAPEGGQLVAYAVKHGRMASARLLFDRGATKRARCADGTPVSFHAAERGATWMLKEILEESRSVDLHNVDGDTLLHAAVRGGQPEMMEILWGYGADAAAVNRHGDSLLHVALRAGRTALVPILLEEGAAVDLVDRAGWQPLHVALDEGDLAAMQVLLENGADPNAAGPGGLIPVAVALERRDWGAAQLLADHDADLEGFLCAAVAGGDADLFAFLMRNGANPNPSLGKGAESPLVLAVRSGRPEMATVLAKAGADPKGKVREGQSLLHLALAMNDVAMVTLLLDHGANVNEEFSYPAKDEFVEHVKWEGLIKWFLKKDRRVTPLMMAADSGNVAMARLLIERGAKKHVYTRRHRHWPINFASRGNHIGVMQLMLGRDPDEAGRSVKVDLSEQKAWVYEKDGKELMETRISSGKKGYKTRTGTFVITNKYRSWTSTIYKGASMPYFQRLSCGDFGFHRGYVPKYPASHGCIRVPSGNASKLYTLTSLGDVVTIVE